MSWQHYIKEKTLYSDIEIVKFLIDRDVLDGRSRKRSTVYKRYYLYNKLYEKNRLSTTLSIGKLFDRDHSSVVYGLQQWKIVRNYKDVKELMYEYDSFFNSQSIER